MKKLAVVLTVVAALGCARVNLQTEKPLKVDITMRVDVYQHVVKEAASIEDQIYGTAEKKLNLLFTIEEAYAQESASEIDAAIQQRKSRAPSIEGYFDQGYIGEDKEALLVIRDQSLAPDMRAAIENLIKEENKDRNTIYAFTARKNGADFARTRQIFFDDHYKRAGSDWWFEVLDTGTGTYTWVRK